MLQYSELEMKNNVTADCKAYKQGITNLIRSIDSSLKPDE